MERVEGIASLPQDAEDQMLLGIKIITGGFRHKMAAMEQEVRATRIGADEAKNKVATLQKKSTGLEHELLESHHKCQQLTDENRELFNSVGALRKQIARLDALKHAVAAHIQDDHAEEAHHGDSHVLTSEEYVHSAIPVTRGESRQMSFSGHYAPQASAPPRSATNYAPPPQPPAPMVAGPPAPVAPSEGLVDGKQFFRQARMQLSYESFNAFLASIKRLNAQQQTREQTLDEARRVFGEEHVGLYRDFATLLNTNHL